MDAQSDVDFMVVFPDPGLRPQAYLDRLRRFVEARYQTSEIFQDSPTIALDLNHIKFELVPALRNWDQSFFIPNGPANWLQTEPTAFHLYLNQRDAAENKHLRPTIRIAKYWNALNGYPIPSFQLEGWIAATRYNGCRNLADYFLSAIDQLPTQYDAQWKKERVARSKRQVETVRQYMAYPAYARSAEEEVRKLIP